VQGVIRGYIKHRYQDKKRKEKRKTPVYHLQLERRLAGSLTG
jgi:hypothetical protein